MLEVKGLQALNSHMCGYMYILFFFVYLYMKLYISVIGWRVVVVLEDCSPGLLYEYTVQQLKSRQIASLADV
jgi:hypothetical protein